MQLRLSLLHDVLQLLSVLVLLAFSIAPGDTLVPILVEVDRATMPQQRLRDKINRYVQYAVERGWSERHNFCPVLLLLTTTVSRAGGILDGVAAAEPPADLVVAASATVNDPDAAVRSPVWRTRSNALPRPLHALLTARVADRPEPPF